MKQGLTLKAADCIMDELKSHHEVKIASVLGQQSNGDCLTREMEIPELPAKVHITFPKTKLSELSAIWEQWDLGRRERFQQKFRDIALLLPVEIDETLLRVVIHFWDPSYRCFVFNQQDLTPTIEEYSSMLRVETTNPYKIYWRTQKRGSNIRKLFQMRQE